jgi:ankyrin repeat protein
MGSGSEKRFLKAVQAGDANEVVALLAEGFDPNAKVASGRTGLMIAARAGHVAVVDALLDAGADVGETDEEGDTALAWAVSPRYLSTGGRWLDRAGIGALNWLSSTVGTTAEKDAKTPEQAHAAAQIVAALISAGALVRVRNAAGETPLQLASRTGSVAAARSLIADGADLHPVDAAGASPIIDAAVRSYWEIVLAILEAGATAVRTRTALDVLTLAAKQNRSDVAGILLSSVSSLDLEEALPLAAWTGREGHADLLDRILELRSDPGVAAAALHAGVKAEQPAIVERALAAGAPVDDRDTHGRTALMEARPAVVDALLRFGADPNTSDELGWTPLMLAAGRQDAWTVVRLLAAGASVTPRNSDGKDAGDAAAAGVSSASSGILENWDSGWIGKLIDRVIDLDAQGDAVAPADRIDGMPILFVAAELDRADLINTLIDAGADPTETGPHGETPLMRAAQWGHVTAVIALLTAGADVNARSEGGETPLMWAGSGPVAEALLAAGADPSARDSAGRTALIGAVMRRTLSRVPRTPGPGTRVAGDLGGLVGALLAAGSDVDAGGDDGRTALAAAIARDRSFGSAHPAIRMLIDRGANVDLADVDGMTPLMHAASHCDADVLRLLVDAGADVKARDAKGRTALQHASHCGSTKPGEILTGVGAT